MPSQEVHQSLNLKNGQPEPDDDDAQGEDLDDVSQQLEVTFQDETNPRRKSSMNSAQRPHLAQRYPSCLVHGVLHDKRLVGSNEDHQDAVQDQNKKLDKDPDGSDHSKTQSRLLTKKELSDMAFSIRELSRRLGRFKLKLKVRNVLLLTKLHDESLVALTKDMANWLLERDENYTVWVEETLKDHDKFDYQGLVKKDESRSDRLKFWTEDLCHRKPHTFDIVLALGGDGTVLYASWLFQRIVPPVVSFALGSLGFLTKFDFDDFRHTLTDVFKDGLTVSLRLRLEATVMRSQSKGDKSADLVEQLIGDEADDQQTHKAERTHDILNDLVLDRGPNPTMSSIEVFGHSYHITTVQADGVVVATPTGSTAYNLAAGGSLCHPDNPVILVTAICAHTLSFRPIILPDTVVLRLGVPYDARASSWVSFDGKERVELNPGDYVTISASRFPFPTVMPIGKGSEEWIDSLSETLQWNSRKKQKAFEDGDGGGKDKGAEDKGGGGK